MDEETASYLRVLLLIYSMCLQMVARQDYGLAQRPMQRGRTRSSPQQGILVFLETAGTLRSPAALMQ